MNLLSALFLSALLSATLCMAKAMINRLPEDSVIVRIIKIDPESEGHGEAFLHEVPLRYVEYGISRGTDWDYAPHGCYNFEGQKDFAQPMDIRLARIEWGHELAESLLYGEDGADLIYTFMSGDVDMMEDLTDIRGVVCRSFVVEEEVEEEEDGSSRIVD